MLCRHRIRQPGSLAIAAWCVCAASLLIADDGLTGQPQRFPHQITGLFSPDRVEDLRLVLEQLRDVKLVAIDFARAEATLEYDPAQLFPNSTPEQIVMRLDQLLRQASRHTFGVKPLPAISQERLTFVEIPVVGLDCKACSLAAYEAIYRIDGVERATASFRDSLVTAWIDPEKTNRAALEEALTKKRVTLPTPLSK